jgi:hypothetical protein
LSFPIFFIDCFHQQSPNHNNNNKDKTDRHRPGKPAPPVRIRPTTVRECWTPSPWTNQTARDSRCSLCLLLRRPTERK